MKRSGLLFLFPLLAGSAVFTPQASKAPATNEDIETLFTRRHIREQMHNLLDVTSKQSRQLAQD